MPMPSSDRRKHASAHRVAIDAALLSAALMLSYLEHLIPFGPLTHFLGFRGVYLSEGIADLVAGTITSIVIFTSFPRIFRRRAEEVARER